MSLVNLANINEKQLQSFLDSFDNVLCDCDGVIWHLGIPIANVNESLSKLECLGKKVYFVTNNSYASRTDMSNVLKKSKVDVKPQQIINPCLALIEYLKINKFTRNICILGSHSFKKEVENAGLNVIEMEVPNVEDECVLGNPEFLDNLSKDIDQIGAIVIDVDFTLSYLKLLKVTMCLQNPDVLFIVTCTDKTFPMGRKITGFGPDYFVKPIQDITHREPLVFGKPAMLLNDFLVERLHIDNPSRTLFIGDNLECDIGFGFKCGYQTLLVLTGVAKLEHVDTSKDVSQVPNFYINSLGDLHQLIESKLKF